MGQFGKPADIFRLELQTQFYSTTCLEDNKICINCKFDLILQRYADFFLNSLGITVLELAGDLDLPRGGELWHQLRSGILPEEFLSGRVFRNSRFRIHIRNSVM